MRCELFKTSGLIVESVLVCPWQYTCKHTGHHIPGAAPVQGTCQGSNKCWAVIFAGLRQCRSLVDHGKLAGVASSGHAGGHHNVLQAVDRAH